MTGREFKERLARRVRKAGLSLQADLPDRLWIYFQLLAKWNAKINLTGLDLAELTPEGFDRLLIEPLLASPHVHGVRSMIDIGSGGGSPAIPLALAVEGVSLVMVEVKTRKSVFLREAIRELALPDARVVTARHESLLANTAFHESYDLLTIRAVRVESRTFSVLQTFVQPGGQLFHFRSGAESQPILPPPLRILETHPLSSHSHSQLVIIQK